MPMPNPAILLPLLANVTSWIMGLQLETNHLVGVADTLKQSIFINGNLARVLLASHKLTPNPAHLAKGLAWCDALVALQHTGEECVTHDGAQPCGWWDTGYDELYLADTGTAVTTLALCFDLGRKPSHLAALNLFDAFVRKGVAATPRCAPLLPGKTDCSYDGGRNETAAGWIIGDGPDAGALGDGYYKEALNTMPYTISTALAGGVFYAELYALGGGGAPAQLGVADGAVSWLLRHIQPNGTIPYIIDPPSALDHTYQCISYSTEAFVDLHLRGGAAALPKLRAGLAPTIEYILGRQDASSGALLPGNATSSAALRGEIQRSARAASLLQWWHQAVDPADERLPAAVDKYIRWLGTEAGAANEGLNSWALPTGFIGLVIADLVDPSWPTFTSWRPTA